MTQKEFFTTVLAMVDPQNTEMVDFATKAIAKIDAKNANAKVARLEKAKENEPIMAEIVNYLGQHKSALGNEIGCSCNISTNKAIALCNKLVESGKVTKTVVSIPKVGKRNAYSLVKVANED